MRPFFPFSRSCAGPIMLSITEVGPRAHDDVVQEGDPKNLAGLPQGTRQAVVLRARVAIPGGMVVPDRDACRVHADGRPKDLAGVVQSLGEASLADELLR